MKKILMGSILITLLVSVVLLVFDRQSKQGILNDITTKESIDIAEKVEKNEEEQQTEQVEIEEAIGMTEEAVESPYLIVIDPGHQAEANHEHEPIGPSATETKPKVASGTAGIETKIPEYVLTLDASLQLQEHLEAKGFDVILTRTSHDVNISNSERALVANDYEADLFLRIHADGAPTADTRGFSLLIPGAENNYTKDIYEESQLAANTIIAALSEDIILLSNGVFPRNDLSGFNWSNVPVVLVELGFMTNPEEDRKLADETYIKELTRMIADGVENYVTNP